MSLKNRQKLYELYNELIITKFKKKNILGEGTQGKVYSYCEDSNSNSCITVKKIYMDNTESKYINKIYSKQALKKNVFIELFCNKLINKLLIENVSPNFIFFYNNYFEEREGICWEDYPYVSYFYNEYIDDAETFLEWIYKKKSLKLLYNAFFQIVTGLYAAQNNFGLMHLDLHAENILVKKIKKGGYFKYIIDNIEYNVPNLGYLFLINDYGFAWIPKTKNNKDREYDINFILNDVKDVCPPKITDDIKYIVKNLKSNKLSFEDLIKNVWFDMYNKTDGELLETYYLDKKIILDKTNKDIIDSGINN